MKKPTKKKEQQTAASLGKRGGLARAKNLTPEQRSASARHAVNARYGKNKPVTEPPQSNKWYGLYDYADPNVPTLVESSRDKVELRKRARMEPDRAWMIEELDYEPKNRIPISPKFEPDTAARLRALEDLQHLDATGKAGQS